MSPWFQLISKCQCVNNEIRIKLNKDLWLYILPCGVKWYWNLWPIQEIKKGKELKDVELRKWCSIQSAKMNHLLCLKSIEWFISNVPILWLNKSITEGHINLLLKRKYLLIILVNIRVYLSIIMHTYFIFVFAFKW